MDSGLKTLSPHKPTPTKSPWGSPMPATPTCSLASVMDEELARSFQAEEEKLLKYVHVHVHVLYMYVYVMEIGIYSVYTNLCTNYSTITILNGLFL